jgi:hypothetical protein
MKSKIQQLFNESLLPVIKNGQAPRHFRRVVLNYVDSRDMVESLRTQTDPPSQLLLGGIVITNDARGVSIRNTGLSARYYDLL